MKRRSFTLIEVLIASFILIIISVGTSFTLSNLMRSWDGLEERADKFNQLVILDRTFRNVVTNSVPFSWRNEEQPEIPTFYGTENELRIVYLHPVTNIKTGGIRFVTFVVDEEGNFVARYQDRPWINGVEDSENVKVSILAKKVESIKFLYAWQNNELQHDDEGYIEWIEEWDQELIVIPLAVRLEVKFQNGDVEHFIWRTSGSGKHERQGNYDSDSRRRIEQL